MPYESSTIQADKFKRLGLGVTLALDDFGTGYSAFQHIVKYPIDCLKIDKSFIDDYRADNNTSIATINAMIAIAHSHNLETVAEGIETQAQSDFLESLDCDLLQGYLYSKPVTWAVFVDLLTYQDANI